MNSRVPMATVPSVTSTHRLTIAMKRRRVIRVARGSEIGTDREGEGQPAEERVLLRRIVRRGAAPSRDLLVPAIGKQDGWNLVSRAHAVEWGKPLLVRRLVVDARTGGSGVRVVPHVHLKGTDRREDAHPHAWRPAQPLQREARQRRHPVAEVAAALPHASAIQERGELDQLGIDRAAEAQLVVADDQRVAADGDDAPELARRILEEHRVRRRAGRETWSAFGEVDQVAKLVLLEAAHARGAAGVEALLRRDEPHRVAEREVATEHAPEA